MPSTARGAQPGRDPAVTAQYLQRQYINVVANFPGGNLGIFTLLLLQIGLLNHIDLEGSRGIVSFSPSPCLLFLLWPRTAVGKPLSMDACAEDGDQQYGRRDGYWIANKKLHQDPQAEEQWARGRGWGLSRARLGVSHCQPLPVPAGGG